MSKKINSVIYTIGYRDQDLDQTFFLRNTGYLLMSSTPKSGMMFTNLKSAEKKLQQLETQRQLEIDFHEERLLQNSNLPWIQERLQHLKNLRIQVLALEINFNPA